MSLSVSADELRAIAKLVAKELEPLVRLRMKKQLRPNTAAFVYDCSTDFLAKQPVDLLPKIVMGPKFTAYRVDDLDNLFERHLIRG